MIISENEEMITILKEANNLYQNDFRSELPQHVHGQHPSLAILTCADSRVIPEYIFQKSIGELFIVRVAGNVAVDTTVLTSLEYAVDHLKIPYLLILGHTHCGAVKAIEETNETNNPLFADIKQSFSLDETDHIKANVLHQLAMIPQRSSIINDAIKNNRLTLFGGIYHLKNGKVTFL